MKEESIIEERMNETLQMAFKVGISHTYQGAKIVNGDRCPQQSLIKSLSDVTDSKTSSSSLHFPMTFMLFRPQEI